MEVTTVRTDASKMVREFIVKKHGEDSPILKEFDILSVHKVYKRKGGEYSILGTEKWIDPYETRSTSDYINSNGFLGTNDYDNVIGKYNSDRIKAYEREWEDFKRSEGSNCTFSEWAAWKLIQRKRELDYITEQAEKYHRISLLLDNSNPVDMVKNSKTYNHRLVDYNDPFNY